MNEIRLAYNAVLSGVQNPTAVFPGLTVFSNISIQQDTYELADNVNIVAGTHTIRFGYDGRRYISPLNYAWRGFGTYSFSNLETFLRDMSPDIFGSRSFGNTAFSGNQWNHYAYINDAWRVRPNFNINLGVRYEYVTVPETLRLQQFNSIASVPGVLDFNEPSVQTHNFARALGIAFSPTNMRNTVFRAGFGMNYDALAYSTMASMLPTVPPGFVSTEFTNIFTPIFGFFGNGGLIQTVPTNVFNPSVTPEEARAATSTFIPDQRLPYTMQWNANLQQSLGRFMLNVGYLGIPSFNLPFQNVLNQTARVSATQNLPLFYTTPTQSQLNAVTTNLGQLEAMNNNPLAGAGFTSPIFSYASECRSWYDGLLVRGSQRFSAGLQMDASWAGSITERVVTIPSTTTGIQPISRRCGTSVPSAARASTSFATSSRT